MSDAIAIRTDLRPGDLGRLIALHGTAYIDADHHFGIAFEAFVAGTVSRFIRDDGGRGRVWLAERGPDLVGCAAMIERPGADGETRGQLRWVLADASVRGTGLGERLVRAAVDYARAQGWREVFLETTEGLDASMGLYRKLGFIEKTRSVERMWSGEMPVITMSLALR